MTDQPIEALLDEVDAYCNGQIDAYPYDALPRLSHELRQRIEREQRLLKAKLNAEIETADVILLRKMAEERHTKELSHLKAAQQTLIHHVSMCPHSDALHVRREDFQRLSDRHEIDVELLIKPVED